MDGKPITRKKLATKEKVKGVGGRKGVDWRVLTGETWC